MAWLDDKSSSGGCLFIAASTELDDRDGPIRDYLAEQQQQLVDLLAGLAQAAVAADEFRPDVDVRQLAFELHGIVLSTHHAQRLLRDPQASLRAQAAFERLCADALPRPTRYRDLSAEAKKHERSFLSGGPPVTAAHKSERSKS